MSVSLSQHGLHAPGGLDCPAGGTHSVGEQDLIMIVKRGGGMLTCVKCQQPIRFEKLDEA